MNQEIINSIYYLLPELTLALSIIIITFISGYSKENRISRYTMLAGLAAAFTLTLFRFYLLPSVLFSGLMVTDPFGCLGKSLIIFCALVIILIFNSKPWSSNNCILILLITLAAISSVSSSNLLMTFVSLEALNIALYILLSDERKASLKYFIYSVVSSGLLLYGISLLYGMTGSLDYYEISRSLSSNPVNDLTLSIIIILIIAGLGFRLMLFPFSFILPSVSGSISLRKISLTAIMPVLAGSLVICRLFLTIFHDAGSFISHENAYRLLNTVNWQNIFAIASAASIITGTFVILWQRSIKKIFIFFLIAQSGYLLIPLSVPSPVSTETFLLNLIIFIINSHGLITCLHIFNEKIKPANGKDLQLDDLKGLGKASPYLFVCLIIFLTSSSGFPLTIGFTGKLYIYSVLFNGSYLWAGIIAVFCILMILYFTFKTASLVFSGTSNIKNLKPETIHVFILLLLVTAEIVFGIYPAPVLDLCRYSLIIFNI